MHYYEKNFNYKPEGRRNIGRPQTKWGDDFWEEGTGLIDDDDTLLWLENLDAIVDSVKETKGKVIV